MFDGDWLGGGNGGRGGVLVGGEAGGADGGGGEGGEHCLCCVFGVECVWSASVYAR